MEEQKKYRTVSFLSIDPKKMNTIERPLQSDEKYQGDAFKWKEYIRDLENHCDELKSILDDTIASYKYQEDRYIDLENRFMELDIRRQAAIMNLTEPS